MTCRLFGAKPLSKPMLGCQLKLEEQISVKFLSKYKTFIHDNASENIVCKKAAILSRRRWVEQGAPGAWGWECWMAASRDSTPHHREGNAQKWHHIGASKGLNIPQGPTFKIKTIFTSIGIPILKRKRFWNVSSDWLFSARERKWDIPVIPVCFFLLNFSLFCWYLL